MYQDPWSRLLRCARVKAEAGQEPTTRRNTVPEHKLPVPENPPPDERKHVPNPYWGTHGEPGEDTTAQEATDE